MNKLLLAAALAALIAVGAFAQSANQPTVGTFGLTASVSNSDNIVGGLYYATPNVIVAPYLGFWNQTTTSKTSSASADAPSSWFEIGTGVYYELTPFGDLSFDLGPALTYWSETSKASSTADTYNTTYFSFDANVLVKVQVTKNLAVFSQFGGFWNTRDNKDTTVTSNTETVVGTIGLQTVSLGVAYYFR